MDKIQANLKPETVQRIAFIANRPVTRGIDKMINQCLDLIEQMNCKQKNQEEDESEDE